MRTLLIIFAVLFGILLSTTYVAQAQTPAPTATPVLATTAVATPEPIATSQPLDWNIILPAILTLLTAVIGLCVWPITILFGLFILRNHLPKILRNLRLFKLKDFQVEFAESVEKLKEVAEKGNLPEPIVDPKPESKPPISESDNSTSTRSREEYLLALVDTSPRGAILEAWILVDFALREIAHRTGIDANPLRLKPSELNAKLRRAGLVSPQVLELADGLRTLRNKAIHESGATVTADEASNYIMLAMRVLKSISVVNPNQLKFEDMS